PDTLISQVYLPQDSSGIHLGAFFPSQSHPIVIISLFAEPLPTSLDDATPHTQCGVRFRKFACEPARQIHGAGTKLLAHELSVARSELSSTTFWCDARTSSSPWYTKRGLVASRSFFKGPVEYIRMKMDIMPSIPEGHVFVHEAPK
ncbi:hypothetical protein BD779DRAFT_1450221, partial [Infundibulicybe gibba]